MDVAVAAKIKETLYMEHVVRRTEVSICLRTRLEPRLVLTVRQTRTSARGERVLQDCQWSVMKYQQTLERTLKGGRRR